MTATTISIYRNNVWVGDGLYTPGDIECMAVLGRTQDESDETYEAIVEAILNGFDSVRRPSGRYTWVIEKKPTKAENAYWLDGSAYCTSCAEDDDSPALSDDELDRAEFGPATSGQCACCGRHFGGEE